MFRRILAVAAAVLLVTAGAQGEGCKLKRLAALDLTHLPSGAFSTTIQINGQPFHMLVVTGSDHTMLTERAATALGLKVEPFPNSIVSLWGGMQLKYLAKTETVQLGRLQLGASTFYVIPNDRIGPAVDGLIGTDLLARFDADFDFSQGKLNLLEHNSCDGHPVYWADDNAVATIPFENQKWDRQISGIAINKILLTVNVEGKPVLAGLDTGSYISTLDLERAQADFDLKPESPGMVKLKRPEGSFGYTFKSLAFGGVQVNNAKIRLDPYSVHQMGKSSPKMLIGADVLSRLHLYIAYQERKLYVTDATAHKAP